MNEKETIKTLIKIINEISYEKTPYIVFKDLLEICAIVEHQTIFILGLKNKNEIYEKLETRYLKLIKEYTKVEVENITKFYSVLKQFYLKTNYADILGQVYEELNLSNKKTGQFFTPYHICKLMSQMTLADIQKTIDKKGFFTLAEPCAGAGRLIISAAESLAEQNINTGYMFFQAVDIDQMCFHMSYIQLSMLGLNGTVIWGDVLQAEQYDFLRTPSLMLLENKLPKHFIKNISQIHSKEFYKIDNTKNQFELF